MLRYSSHGHEIARRAGDTGVWVRRLCGGHRVARMAAGSSGWVSSLKLYDFNKQNGEEVEREAYDFLCVIIAAAALESVLGALLTRA